MLDGDNVISCICVNCVWLLVAVIVLARFTIVNNSALEDFFRKICKCEKVFVSLHDFSEQESAPKYQNCATFTRIE